MFNKENYTMKLILFSLFLFGLIGSSIPCSPPGIPGWRPMTVEELSRKAPLIIKANLVKSFKSAVTFKLRSRRCFNVSQIYKGSLHPNDASYICADKFGDGAACLSDVSYGRTYIIFLNKVINGYVARYDEIHSAVHRFSDHSSFSEELRKGLCCPPDNDSCDKQLPCRLNQYGVIQCDCGFSSQKGSIKGSRKGASPPGPPTRRPGPPGSK